MEKYKYLGGFLLVFFVRFVLAAIINAGVVFAFYNIDHFTLPFLFVLILNAFILLYSVSSCFLIYSERNEKGFDVLSTMAYIAAALLIVSLFIEVMFTSDDGSYTNVPNIVASIASVVIWIEYLSKSKRVRVYFNLPPDEEKQEDNE